MTESGAFASISAAASGQITGWFAARGALGYGWIWKIQKKRGGQDGGMEECEMGDRFRRRMAGTLAAAMVALMLAPAPGVMISGV